MDGTCQRYRIELSAYLDGQLEKTIKVEMDTHLTDCRPCTEELNSLKSLTSLLGSGLKLKDGQPEMLDLWALIEQKLPSVCELMQEEFSAFLDGELTAPAQEGVNSHLKECQPCLGQFKLLNEANRVVVKGLELPESVVVDLWPAVKARLNEDCALILSELSAYADQEVPTPRHRNITSHLLECAGCSVQFSQLSTVGDILRDSYKASISEDFDLWPAIRSQLAVVPISSKMQSPPPSQPVKARPNRRRLYLASAAAAMIGVTGSLACWTLWPRQARAEAVSSEAYLIESALVEPADAAEAVVYEQQ